MSTVCYKDGVMAGDTLLSLNDELHDGVEKIGRTHNFLFGYVGQLAGLSRMYEWISSIPDEVTPKDFYQYESSLNMGSLGATVLLVQRGDNTLWSLASENLSAIQLPAKFDSVGSGAMYALGAMYAGKTAEQAVGVAKHYDAFTGGTVQSISFDDPIHCPKNVCS